MAKTEIVEKLKDFMATLPITDEANVAYLLAEVRKIFDHNDSLSRSCQSLRFYCNWALHIDLDQKAAQTYLNAVMPILTEDNGNDEKAHAESNSLLSFQSFRYELEKFLKHHDMDELLCSDASNWTAFLRAYSGLVQNSKLILKRDEQAQPRGPHGLVVKSVTVESIAGGELIGGTTFPMVWVISYTDDRVAELKSGERGFIGAKLDFREPLLTSAASADSGTTFNPAVCERSERETR